MEDAMHTSATHQIDGGRTSTPIARIEAASNWHAATGNEWTHSRREHALRNLILRTEDADAVVGLEFEVDVLGAVLHAREADSNSVAKAIRLYKETLSSRAAAHVRHRQIMPQKQHGSNRTSWTD
jgi:hypothetical protein